jgi:hypothetical protein
MPDMNLSKTAQKTLLSNFYSSELECYMDKAPRKEQVKILTEFVNDPKAMKDWISDLRHDAELSKDDFPEHAKTYTDTADELEALLKDYKLTVFCANGDEKDSMTIKSTSWKLANAEAQQLLEAQGLKLKYKVKFIPAVELDS